MDVIGFLYVSLVSSAVKVADAHAYVQRLVSVVRMATVFEECTVQDQRSVVLFVCKRSHSKGYSLRNIFGLRWEVFVA
jgi:hypothetical protein